MEYIIETIKVISNLSTVILLISIVLIMAGIKKVPSYLLIVGLFLLVSLLIEWYSSWLSKQKLNNLFLLHIYTLLQFILWTFFYKKVLSYKSFINKLFLWILILGSTGIVFNSVFFEPMNTFNSNSKSIVHLVLVAYSIYYFFDVFGRVDFNDKTNRGLALINFSALLYFSGSLFVFMTGNYLQKANVAENAQLVLWLFNVVLTFVFYLLILIGIIYIKPKRLDKQLQPES